MTLVDGQVLARVRSGLLDRIRGLAVAVMVLDHVALLLDVQLVRVTVGRAAVPLFFLLAGHLAGRLSWRHARIAALGLLLPVLVPWLDWPNVLVLWAVGCVVLWWLRRVGLSPWLLVVLALTVAANGWGVQGPRSYELWAMLALMACGALLPRSAFSWGERLPAFLEVVGRHPVGWYVGHVLAVDFAMVVWFGGSS